MGAAYYSIIFLGKEYKGVGDMYVVNTLFLLRYGTGSDTSDVVTMWYDRKEKRKRKRNRCGDDVVRQKRKEKEKKEEKRGKGVEDKQ